MVNDKIVFGCLTVVACGLCAALQGGFGANDLEVSATDASGEAVSSIAAGHERKCFMENVRDEKEKNRIRLVKISHIGSILFKILAILCLVASALALSGLIASFFVDWGWVQSEITSHKANPSFDVSLLNTTNAAVACTSGFLGAGTGAVNLYFVHRLFETIYQAKTPFTAAAVKNLNVIGIVSLAQSIGVSLFMSILVGATHVAISTSGWGMSVGFALFIFLLSLVFRYGVSLQEESDTTL